MIRKVLIAEREREQLTLRVTFRDCRYWHRRNRIRCTDGTGCTPYTDRCPTDALPADTVWPRRWCSCPPTRLRRRWGRRSESESWPSTMAGPQRTSGTRRRRVRPARTGLCCWCRTSRPRPCPSELFRALFPAPRSLCEPLWSPAYDLHKLKNYFSSSNSCYSRRRLIASLVKRVGRVFGSKKKNQSQVIRLSGVYSKFDKKIENQKIIKYLF